MVLDRRGYTFTEMLMVLLVISGLAFFTLPRFSGLHERSRITAARQEIEAAIATARAAAIQKGRTARLLVRANQVSVTETWLARKRPSFP